MCLHDTPPLLHNEISLNRRKGNAHFKVSHLRVSCNEVSSPTPPLFVETFAWRGDYPYIIRCRLYAQVADWEAQAWIHRRLSFAIMRGVAEPFVGRMSDDFGW